MPLPSAQPNRQRLHTRTVICDGFLREDGLWDIEGHLTDIKGYSFKNKDRGGEIQPGEPLHGMSMRMTVDNDLTIQDIEAVTDYSPFAICPNITPQFKKLIGLQINKGFNKGVILRLGGVQGCTHLVELLRPMATTAFQTVYSYRARLDEQAGKPVTERPGVLDTCHALRVDGPIVAREWPQFYQPPAKAAGQEGA
jgi:hypothetical protein